jgi:hypothetical protein
LWAWAEIPTLGVTRFTEGKAGEVSFIGMEVDDSAADEDRTAMILTVPESVWLWDIWGLWAGKLIRCCELARIQKALNHEGNVALAKAGRH